MILPAHRIWDHDETLKNTASTVVWSAKGWRELLFDRKKLTWEHAAMTLEPATNSLINIKWQLFLLTRKVHASSSRDTWRRPTFRILNNEVHDTIHMSTCVLSSMTNWSLKMINNLVRCWMHPPNFETRLQIVSSSISAFTTSRCDPLDKFFGLSWYVNYEHYVLDILIKLDCLIDFFGILTPLSAIFQLYHGDRF